MRIRPLERALESTCCSICRTIKELVDILALRRNTSQVCVLDHISLSSSSGAELGKQLLLVSGNGLARRNKDSSLPLMRFLCYYLICVN